MDACLGAAAAQTTCRPGPKAAGRVVSNVGSAEVSVLPRTRLFGAVARRTRGATARFITVVEAIAVTGEAGEQECPVVV